MLKQATLRSGSKPLCFDFNHNHLDELQALAQHMNDLLFDSTQNEKIALCFRLFEDSYQSMLDVSDKIFYQHDELIHGEDMLVLAKEYATYALGLAYDDTHHYFCSLDYFYFPIDVENKQRNTLIFDGINLNYRYLTRTQENNDYFINLAIKAEKREMDKRLKSHLNATSVIDDKDGQKTFSRSILKI